MKISTEKSKILVNSTTNANNDNINMYGEQLENVKHFKYLGSVITSDGSSEKEIQTRIGIASSSMNRLKSIWKSRHISCKTKIRLYKSLIISVLSYGCESWTLLKSHEKRLHAFDMKALRRILNIPWHHYKTNEYVMRLAEDLAGPIEPAIITIKRRKLQWFGHVIRHPSLANTILQGWVTGARKQGRQRKQWLDNILEWTGLGVEEALRVAELRHTWRKMVRGSARLPDDDPDVVMGE